MNEESNTPMSATSGGIASWFSTWMTAVTKPNEQTYATLAEHPDAASNSRAFTWVFLAGTVSGLVSGLISAILSLVGYGSGAALGQFFGGDAGRGVAFSFGVAICGAPVVGAIGALGFAIVVGIVQWIAKMFKGVGTYSQLAYSMAAISVPFTLLSSFLTPFSVLPFVGLCFNGLSGILSLYVLFLEIMAVKGVNKFGWGQAAGSVLLPVIVIACCAVVAVTLMTTLGIAVGETFNEINNNLP